MEKVMTIEEKIRRAEEIYQRRRQGEELPVTKVADKEKKNFKLLRKMVIKILICVVIYLVIYTVQNNEYIFSNDFINKTKEMLSYDTNFIGLYESIKNNVTNFIKKENDNETNNQILEKLEETNDEGQSNNEETKEEKINEEQNQETEIKKEQEQQQEEVIKNLSQDEIDIKNTVAFIKPVEGTVSSKYGIRDTATGNVPKNHTGTDIAANTGTKIKSATDGEVVLSSEEGDYRKAFEDSNW